ncbi:hypothetical protein [Anianabacter salinae]|uniref:hypothetical protein n=1 Tax=Anianabacter salinae TaxID=2851023 RepID=UPI00225DD5BA|nr:hypothetical protein [Anianabacter salinae]MBV0913205.1 hypothetical protein [Anianabacter salinae]
MGEVNDFGRRNPAVFLGGAALTGFAAVRAARASQRDRGAGNGDPASSAVHPETLARDEDT